MDNNLNQNNEQQVVQEVPNNKGKKSNIGVIVILVIIIVSFVGYIAYDKVLSTNFVDNEDKNGGDVVHEDNLSDEDKYQPVINEYQIAINDDDYNNSNYNYINNYYFHNSGNDFYYAFYDVDNNGKNELIISVKELGPDGFNSVDTRKIIDIFTHGNDITRIGYDLTKDDLVSFYICDNGIIKEDVVNNSRGRGDFEAILEYYKIEDDGYNEKRLASYDYYYKSDIDNNEVITITDLENNKKLSYSSLEELDNLYISNASVLSMDSFNWEKID